MLYLSRPARFLSTGARALPRGPRTTWSAFTPFSPPDVASQAPLATYSHPSSTYASRSCTTYAAVFSSLFRFSPSGTRGHFHSPDNSHCHIIPRYAARAAIPIPRSYSLLLPLHVPSAHPSSKADRMPPFRPKSFFLGGSVSPVAQNKSSYFRSSYTTVGTVHAIFPCVPHIQDTVSSHAAPSLRRPRPSIFALPWSEFALPFLMVFPAHLLLAFRRACIY